MRRLNCLLMLAVSSFAAASAPLWKVPNVAMRGFTPACEIITVPTAPGLDKGWSSSLQPRAEVRNPANGAVLRQLEVMGAPQRLRFLAVSSDTQALAWPVGGPLEPGLHGQAAGGTTWQAGPAGLAGLGQLLISPDGQKLYAGNWNGYVQVWNMISGQRERTVLTGWGVKQLTLNADGSRLFVGGRGFRDVVFDTGNWKTVWQEQGGYSAAWPHGVSFSPDGQTLAVADGLGPVHLWNLNVPGQAIILPRITFACDVPYWKYRCASGPQAVAYSADGQNLMVTYSNSTAVLYNAQTLREKARRVGLDGLTWLAPSGKMLVEQRFNTQELRAYTW